MTDNIRHASVLSRAVQPMCCGDRLNPQAILSRSDIGCYAEKTLMRILDKAAIESIKKQYQGRVKRSGKAN